MFLLLIKTFKLNKKTIIFTIILIILATSIMIFYSFADNNSNETENSEDKNFIKWVDFNVSSEALNLTAKLDIDSHNNDEEIKYNWIELLAYLACQNGGNFKNFKQTHLSNLVEKLQNGQTMEDLTSDMKFYDYYFESYSAVLSRIYW